MASSSSILCLLLAITGFHLLARAANEYKVGDKDGWHVPADNDPDFYQNWASKIKFLVGDSIVFEYQNDSVVKVSKRGYYHCNETSDGLVPRDGSVVFLLDRPGFYYFASGDLEHCRQGQRLMVEVTPPQPSMVSAPSPHPSGAAPCTASSLLTAAVMIGSWWCLFFHKFSSRMIS